MIGLDQLHKISKISAHFYWGFDYCGIVNIENILELLAGKVEIESNRFGQFFYDLTLLLEDLYNLSKIDTEKVVLEEKIGELQEKIIVINSVLHKMQESLGFDHKLWYEETINNNSKTNQMLKENFEVYMNINGK